MINPASILLIILAALLIVAAVGDIRSRIIPNWLNAAIALLAIPFWFAAGLGAHDMLIQIGLAGGVLAIFAGCFIIGMMGGGDVKMISALALWMPLGKIFLLLVWMALAGGVITIGMLIYYYLRKNTGKIEIPYGVAISASALLLVTNDILTNTGA
ncbi:prepilin peptidase [Sphingomonas sp. MMS24-J13]|uniref:A24 family peptidase n=1 Tax=Sphingomonas sp. MMS24-J13 TaxID=3238686 RepID=UPI00384E703F